MRAFSFIATLLLAVGVLSGQREYDTWFFGENAGVRFDGGTATPTAGPINTSEASAVWCDPTTGAILFSTDGQTVYRADGTIMPNGTNLAGGYSSTQGALIIPHPGKHQHFYICTLGELTKYQVGTELNFYLADLSSDPNGIIIPGEHTSWGRRDSLSEKMTGTLHCDGTSTWVLTHHHDANTFTAYLVTEDSIQQTTSANVGESYNVPPSVQSGSWGLGMMKFDASGSRIIMASPYAQRLELFDFDLFEGTVSNPRILGRDTQFYGVCFSPNSRFVYATTWSIDPNTPGEVIQFSVDGSGPPRIVGTLYASSQLESGGMQRGPDGKIYIADGGSLSVIEDPDVPGMACNFRSRVIAFPAPTRALVGLPNLMDNVFDRDAMSYCAPPITAMESDSVVCEGACIAVTDRSMNSPTSWDWYFPGGTPERSSAQSPPPICYQTEGTYLIQLIATNKVGSDTAYRYVRVEAAPMLDGGSDVVLCDSAYGQLSATGAVRYEWEWKPGMSNQLRADPVVRPFETTTYVVHGWNVDGCEAIDSVTVFVRIGESSLITYTADPVNGQVDDSVDVVVRRTAGTVFETVALDVALPTLALHGPRIIRGRDAIIDPASGGAIRVRVVDDGTSDTVAIIRAHLLLFGGTQQVSIAAVSSVTCDSVIGQGASITFESCYGAGRAVLFQGTPLTILGVDVVNNTVTIGGYPRSSVDVAIYDVQGREICRLATVLSASVTTLTLPCHHLSIGFLRVRSGEVGVSRPVIFR